MLIVSSWIVIWTTSLLNHGFASTRRGRAPSRSRLVRTVRDSWAHRDIELTHCPHRSIWSVRDIDEMSTGYLSHRVDHREVRDKHRHFTVSSFDSTITTFPLKSWVHNL